jgi:RimJ/RimL family protein N-acetyltransferase
MAFLRAYNGQAVASIQPLLIDLPDELVGPRITVRPYRDDDAPALFEAVDQSRLSVGEWMPWVTDYRSVDDALATTRRTRARWVTREDLVVGIFDRSSGRLLGGSGLHRIDWTIRRFEIGYWLRDSAVGRGYVTETVQVLTRFAFDHLAAHRVEIRMGVRNTRSRVIPERLGFVYEGCMRQAMPDIHGQPGDILVFALIRTDYERLPWRNADSADPGR